MLYGEPWAVAAVLRKAGRGVVHLPGPPEHPISAPGPPVPGKASWGGVGGGCFWSWWEASEQAADKI